MNCLSSLLTQAERWQISYEKQNEHMILILMGVARKDTMKFLY